MRALITPKKIYSSLLIIFFVTAVPVINGCKKSDHIINESHLRPYSFSEIYGYQKLLKDGKYKEYLELLDTKLTALSKGEIHEFEIDAILKHDLHVGDSFEDDIPMYDTLVEMDHTNYLGLLLRGNNYYKAAWEQRGNKYMSETSEEQKEGMRKYTEKSLADLNSSVTNNPNVAYTYSLLLSMYRTNGTKAEIKKIYAQALKHTPYSFRVHSNYVDAFEPRWGGSIIEMRNAVRETEKFAKDYPLLTVLKGKELAEESRQAIRPKNYAKQLELAERALEFGQYSGYLLHACNASSSLKNYNKALKHCGDFLKLRPLQDYEKYNYIYAAQVVRSTNPVPALKELGLINPNHNKYLEYVEWVNSKKKK